MAVVHKAQLPQELNKAEWLFSISSNTGISRSPGGFKKILFYHFLQVFMNSWSDGTGNTENINVLKWLGKNSLKQLPKRHHFLFRKSQSCKTCWINITIQVQLSCIRQGKWTAGHHRKQKRGKKTPLAAKTTLSHSVTKTSFIKTCMGKKPGHFFSLLHDIHPIFFHINNCFS